MDYNSFLELVQKRRSIRRIKPDPVPDEYVDKIIEAARWAPSGFNTQPWEFIVIKAQELKDKIVPLVSEYRGVYSPRLETTREPWMKSLKPAEQVGQMDWSTAPVFIVLCGDTRTKIGLPMAVRNDHMERESVFNSSLASAFLYMHLAATTLGLASIWVSAVGSTSLHRLVKDILGIPRELQIYDMMALGYPAFKPRPKLLKDKEKMVHYDYCGKEAFRTDEEVNDFARRVFIWQCATTRRGPD